VIQELPESAFLQIADVLAPGRYDLVGVIESYADETIRGDAMCVGGYLFSKSKRKKFDAKWRVFLAGHGLPFFRMSACRPGSYPFTDKDEAECIAIATEAIALIKEHASYGMAIALDKSEFQRCATDAWKASTPYELCVWAFMIGVQGFASNINSLGKIAYFFESGFEDEGKADALMKRIFKDPELNALHRYGGHSFVPKEATSGAQAADMLAWLVRKEFERLRGGPLEKQRAQRKDLISLIEVNTQVLFAEPVTLNFLCRRLDHLAVKPSGNPKLSSGGERQVS